MDNLEDLFLDELADVYDAEKRLTKSLPKLAKAAAAEELRQAFEMHLQETQSQIERLNTVFEAFGEKPKGKECKAMKGLIEEGDDIAAEFKGSVVLDAALISAAQKVEHYEIASYGCLVEWATLLENETAVDVLKEILNEEEQTNEKLTELARAGINDAAMGEAESGEEDEEDAEDDDAEDEISLDADDEEEEDAPAASKPGGQRKASGQKKR